MSIGRLQIDPDVCERNRILCTDAHLAAEARGAAAYRLLRGRILQQVRDKNWSCIGIASPGPGEGKTVTTLNLALAIAREKQRTVYLLDLDMRNPRVMEYLGVRPTASLARYFSESLAAGDVLFETDVEGLILAGATEPVRNASELLATSRLDELLFGIRRRSSNALILIDLPPVTSTDEALVVAPRLDALFIVASEGRTRRDALERSMDLLSDFTVAGMILNRASESHRGGLLLILKLIGAGRIRLWSRWRPTTTCVWSTCCAMLFRICGATPAPGPEEAGIARPCAASSSP